MGDFSFLARLPCRKAQSLRKATRHRAPRPRRKASHPRITGPGSQPPCVHQRIMSRRRSSSIRQRAHHRHCKSPLWNKIWRLQICRAHLEKVLVFVSDDLRLQMNVVHVSIERRGSEDGHLPTGSGIVTATNCISLSHRI